MRFDDFLKYTSKILNVSLPATEAHAKMAPISRMKDLNSIDFGDLNPKKSAVMMLFYPKNEQAYLALIIRTPYKGIHASQIAFPGGKVELIDVDLQATALRETYEEIGINPNKINVIRPFTELYIPPSNYMVYPFLGFCNEELEFHLQEEEVAGLVELSLSDFLDDKIIGNNTMKTSYANAIDVPGFMVNEHFVWGATAMMMSELKEVLRMVL